jgi:hypothetical protein
MWDNRATMHRARPFDPKEVRDMHRATVGCERSTMAEAVGALPRTPPRSDAPLEPIIGWVVMRGDLARWQVRVAPPDHPSINGIRGPPALCGFGQSPILLIPRYALSIGERSGGDRDARLGRH